jgi:hypothetical protein
MVIVVGFGVTHNVFVFSTPVRVKELSLLFTFAEVMVPDLVPSVP